MLGVRQWRHVALRHGAFRVSRQHKLCRWWLDYEQSLFFLGPLSKTLVTRKWPRAWLKARDGKFLLGLSPSFLASCGFAASRTQKATRQGHPTTVSSNTVRWKHFFSYSGPGYPIDINRYQSISVNRLILIIDDQSMAKIRVVIDWYRLSIPIDIDKLVSIGIDWGANTIMLWTVHRNNDVCVLNNFIFACPDCLLQF